MITFTFYPIVNSLIMSLTNWSGYNKEFSFIGFKNYVNLFTDEPDFWESMVVSFKFASICAIIQTILGFILAFTLYHMRGRWKSFYKISLYIPVILPSAVVAVMWSFIYTPDYGLLNQFLRLIGLGQWALGWLGDYKTALGAVIATNTWKYVGLSMILYYVSMLKISKEIIEAATIDGAGKAVQLRKIFIPLTFGTTEINLILSLVGGMKSFDIFYLMTGGGPGKATQVVSMLIYRTAFRAFRYSKALTMSIILFIFILILTIITMNYFSKRKEV